jgi:hypothetical protein
MHHILVGGQALDVRPDAEHARMGRWGEQQQAETSEPLRHLLHSLSQEELNQLYNEII